MSSDDHSPYYYSVGASGQRMAALAADPQGPRRGRGAGLLPGGRAEADDADPPGRDRRRPVVDRGRLRVGEAGGRAGRLRGPELDGLASPCHALAAGARGAGFGPQAGLRASPKKSTGEVELIRLSSPEIRRLLVRLLWVRLSEVEEVLDWSEWRRAHQAFARRCHYKKRGAEPPD